jgi:hypothetical protein
MKLFLLSFCCFEFKAFLKSIKFDFIADSFIIANSYVIFLCFFNIFYILQSIESNLLMHLVFEDESDL